MRADAGEADRGGILQISQAIVRNWIIILRAMGSCWTFVGTEITGRGNYQHSHFTDDDVDTDSNQLLISTLHQALITFSAVSEIFTSFILVEQGGDRDLKKENNFTQSHSY